MIRIIYETDRKNRNINNIIEKGEGIMSDKKKDGYNYPTDELGSIIKQIDQGITPMMRDHLYCIYSMYKPMSDNVISIVKKVRSSVSYNGKILIVVPPPTNTVNVTLEKMKRDPDFNNLKIISINDILSLPDKETKLSGSDIIVSTTWSLTGVHIPDLSVILNFDETSGISPSVLEQLMSRLRRDNRETYYFDTSVSIDNISDHSPGVLIEKQPLLWTTQKMVYPQYMNTPIPTHNYRGFGYNINDVQSGRFIILKPFEVSLENFSHDPIILDSKQVAYINPVSCRTQRFNEQSLDDVGLYIRLLPTSPVILIQGDVVKLSTMELVERLIDTIIERNNIDVKIYDAVVPSHNLNSVDPSITQYPTKHNKFGDYCLEIKRDCVCKEVSVDIMIPPNNTMETLTKQINKIRTIESVNCVIIDIDKKGLCHLVIYSEPLEDYYDYEAISDAINTTIIDGDAFRTSEVYHHFISICKVLNDMIYVGMIQTIKRRNTEQSVDKNGGTKKKNKQSGGCYVSE